MFTSSSYYSSFRPKYYPHHSGSIYSIKDDYLYPLESSIFKQFNETSNTRDWNKLVTYLHLSEKEAEEVLRKKYVHFKESKTQYKNIHLSYTEAFKFLEEEDKQRADDFAAAKEPLTDKQQQAIEQHKLKKEQEQKE